jgi:hypothetical protein
VVLKWINIHFTNISFFPPSLGGLDVDKYSFYKYQPLFLP